MERDLREMCESCVKNLRYIYRFEKKNNNKKNASSGATLQWAPDLTPDGSGERSVATNSCNGCPTTPEPNLGQSGVRSDIYCGSSYLNTYLFYSHPYFILILFNNTYLRFLQHFFP